MDYMRVIIIDGFHKGHVLDVQKPIPEIKLLKPTTITVCDCDNPSFLPPSKKEGERFDFEPQEITYRVCFTSVDGNVALFSRTGESTSIFDGSFAQVWNEKPWSQATTLYFNCYDRNAFQ